MSNRPGALTLTGLMGGTALTGWPITAFISDPDGNPTTATYTFSLLIASPVVHYVSATVLQSGASNTFTPTLSQNYAIYSPALGVSATYTDGQDNIDTVSTQVRFEAGYIERQTSTTLADAETTLSGNVLANDAVFNTRLTVSNATSFYNGTIQHVAVPATGSAMLQSDHGIFTISADGSYTFTANDARPAANHAAEDPLLFTVADGQGGSVAPQLDVHLVGQRRPSTETFNFNFVNSTVVYGADGEAYLTGPDGLTHNVTGVGHLIFNDGQVNEAHGSPLIDDLYYDSLYHDVYLAGIDPEAHYAATGWHEGRNPDPYFNTNAYLSQNPDVAAAGINPLAHYDSNGWQEGRNPGPNFNTVDYGLAYPDVAASHLDPLAQYLSAGELENRVIFPANAGTDGPTNGFDPAYYLANNPDVAAAHVNPLQHYFQNGWHEGRNPSADFNTNFYESQNPDVAAAAIDPLIHYDQFGWHEGRDPSGVFSTNGYLTTYIDVAAAGINPLQHYLQFGMAEGRSPIG